MKELFLSALPILSVLVARGQPVVNFNNRVPGIVIAPIYGVDSCFLYTQMRGDPLQFHGPLLAGSGSTAELWGGPFGSTEESLVPLGTTTFRTGSAGGFVVAVQVPVLAVASGERATFQIRAWDNLGGTVTNWSQAQSGGGGAYGSSALCSPPDVLGMNPLNLVGLTGFKLVPPRPSTNALAHIGGPGTIAWFGSAPFQFPPAHSTTAVLDIDRDGIPDVSFEWSRSTCTTDVPASDCLAPFYVSALNSNALLRQDSQTMVLPSGAMIGSVAPSNATWGSPALGLRLTTYDWSPRFGIGGWCTPLALLEAGYLGVRFQAADGWHYGWIRVRLPNTNGTEALPIITDWAYETRPDVAIKSGATPVPVPLAAPEIVRPGQLRLRWPSAIDKPYQVQSKDRVDAPRWTDLDFAVIATATNSLVDVSIIGPQRFFRVVEAD